MQQDQGGEVMMLCQGSHTLKQPLQFFMQNLYYYFVVAVDILMKFRQKILMKGDQISLAMS